jgi:glycosyltransferase involved in cell wall biosynthesis
MQSARVSVLLPRAQEGFYLPALEAMALGTLVVCPDCVGNRSFCLPGENAFRPGYTVDEIIASTEEALSLSAPQVARMCDRASATAATHSLERERGAFLDVLHAIDDLWERARMPARP